MSDDKGKLFLTQLSSDGAIVSGEAVFRLMSGKAPYFEKGARHVTCFVKGRGQDAISRHMSNLDSLQLEKKSCVVIRGKDVSGNQSEGRRCDFLWKSSQGEVEVTVYDDFFPRFEVCTLNNSCVITSGRVVGAFSFRREKKVDRSLLVFPPEVVVSARDGDKVEIVTECLPESCLSQGFSQVRLIENPFPRIEDLYYKSKSSFLSDFFRDLSKRGVGDIEAVTAQNLMNKSSILLYTDLQDVSRIEKVITEVASSHGVDVSNLDRRSQRRFREGTPLLSFRWSHDALREVEWKPFTEVGFKEAFSLTPSERARTVEGYVLQRVDQALAEEPEEKKWWKFWQK